MSFEQFIQEDGQRIKTALIAAYGRQAGAEAAAEANAYAWEHWDSLSDMANPAGYLYRVGQTAAQRLGKPQGYLPSEPKEGMPHFEPGLAPALENLSQQQRVAVILIHGLRWRQVEVAELLDVNVSTVRTHVERGLEKLRSSLKVGNNV